MNKLVFHIYSSMSWDDLMYSTGYIYDCPHKAKKKELELCEIDSDICYYTLVEYA